MQLRALIAFAFLLVSSAALAQTTTFAGNPVTLTGSISGTTLTVTAASGNLVIGTPVTGAGVTANTYITAQTINVNGGLYF